MKHILILVVLLASISNSALGSRTWVNNKGQSLEAELIDFQGDYIEIKSSRDGKIYEYKISNLSQADQEYLGSISKEDLKNKTQISYSQKIFRFFKESNLFTILGGLASILIIFLARGIIFSNILSGFLFGAIACIVCAFIWAKITVSTEYQIGWMAVGAGFIIGFTVRLTGNPQSDLQGLLAASLTLACCAIGNVFSGIGFIAQDANIPLVDGLLQFDYSQSVEIYKSMFSPIDIVFYCIAVFEGFKFSTDKGEY